MDFIDGILVAALGPLCWQLARIQLERRRDPMAGVAMARTPQVVEPPSPHERARLRLARLKTRPSGQVRFDIAAPDTTLQPGTRPDHRAELLEMLRKPVDTELELGGIVYRGGLRATPARLFFDGVPGTAAEGAGCKLTFRAGGAAWQVYSRIDVVHEDCLELSLPGTVSSANDRSGLRIGVTGLMTLVREGIGAPLPVIDLSARGLAVSCQDPEALRPGERVRVALLLDGAPLMSGSVEVRHVDDDGRVGLKFVGEAARKEMREVLDALR